MLGLIALVLIVLWLLGFLAFHVSASLVHLLCRGPRASDSALRAGRYQNGIGCSLAPESWSAGACLGRTEFLCPLLSVWLGLGVMKTNLRIQGSEWLSAPPNQKEKTS